MDKPVWWPACPYSVEVFPLDLVKEYAEIVPDPDVRTALSGALGRLFWKLAELQIWERYQESLLDDE